MKIALCLSGQPRVIDIGFQKLNQSILQHNDVDVFIHTWFDPQNLNINSVIPGKEHRTIEPNTIDKLISYYKPKKILVEKPKIWKRRYYFPDKVFTHALTWALDVKGGIEVAKDEICNTTNSMYYSIMMSNILKEQYSVETGIEYDLVIRNRLDFSPHIILNFNNVVMDDNVIAYQNLNQPDGMIADWFAMGTTNAMNVYCGLYNHIAQLIKQSNNIDGYWCNELLLKHHLQNNSIIAHPVDYQVHY